VDVVSLVMGPFSHVRGSVDVVSLVMGPFSHMDTAVWTLCPSLWGHFLTARANPTRPIRNFCIVWGLDTR
jgi:hypothetical protein